jgi:hypothetical protein
MKIPLVNISRQIVPGIVLFFLIIPSFALFSQGYTVEGQVTDLESGLPVPMATVYVNGTTRGTISGPDGDFRLERVVLPCELILSHVSYELINVPLRDTAHLKKLDFKMEPRVIRLLEATIIRPQLRDEYLRSFRLLFLGQDYEKSGARILNDSVLMITIRENEQFSVEASGPIMVYLPETGYMLTTDLVRFSVDYSEELKGYHCSILGFYYFEPIETGSRKEQRLQARRRTEVYYNSSMHFCRSLYHNQLMENGYLFQRACIPDAEEGMNPAEVPDFIATYGPDRYGNQRLLLTRFACPDFKILFHYNSRNRPVDLTYMESYRVQRSGLSFLRDSVFIYPSGRIPENNMLFSGSIGKKGVGSMLPADYIPSMQ